MNIMVISASPAYNPVSNKCLLGTQMNEQFSLFQSSESTPKFSVGENIPIVILVLFTFQKPARGNGFAIEAHKLETAHREEIMISSTNMEEETLVHESYLPQNIPMVVPWEWPT